MLTARLRGVCVQRYARAVIDQLELLQPGGTLLIPFCVDKSKHLMLIVTRSLQVVERASLALVTCDPELLAFHTATAEVAKRPPMPHPRPRT